MAVNVAVVVWDTARGADLVPAGADLVPTLAELAAAGTEYTNAISVAPWTLPVHGSLFTGTYPSRHGAHSDSTFLDEDLPTLAEAFGSAGYETYAVSNNTWITEEFGFARGFDTFEEVFVRRRGESALRRATEQLGSALPTNASRGNGRFRRMWRRVRDRVLPGAPDDGSARTLRSVRRWLESREDGRPFFLFANLIEPHLEYRPPRHATRRHLPSGWSYEEAMALAQDPRAYDVGRFEHSAEEWTVLEGLYRAEIAHLDAHLGRLVAALRAAGEWEETVLVVTSDHGENVGDHGMLGHQYSLYETVLHVPLVVTGGAFTGGTDGRDDLVQPVDLAPTLLDAAGVDAAEFRASSQGRSFHPSADEPPRTHAFAEYRGPQPPVERLEERFGDVPDAIYERQRSLEAVRTDRYKFVRGGDGSEELYDLAADPEETTDVAARAPRRVDELRATLERWSASFEHASAERAAEMAASTQKRLANLGYL